MRDAVESFFYEYMSGEYESVTRPLWLYRHAVILLATALVDSRTHAASIMTLLVLSFPVV